MTMSTSSPHFSLFKDRIASRILGHPTTDAAELDDFSTYLATESWPFLPAYVRNASHETKSNVPADVDDIPLDATPISFVDTLISYGFASDHEDALSFLRKTVSEYLDDACTPPPVWSKTRTKECEICEREIPLTYHHLIPRSTHAKVLKKKWHPEAMLNSVAWLCRSVIHGLHVWF